MGGGGFDSASFIFAGSDLIAVVAADIEGGGLRAERLLEFGLVIAPYLMFVSRGSSEAHSSVSCLVTSESACKSFNGLGSRLYMCIEVTFSYSARVSGITC